MTITTESIIDRAGLEEAWRIRFEVFVDEQRVPAEEEVDARDEDPTTLHVLGFLDGKPVATGRILHDSPGHVHIGRMAVRAYARGTGVGAAVMAHLEGAALAEYGIRDDAGNLTVEITLSAQEAAMGFYARLGYAVTSGERYLDAGIWHQDMARNIVL